VGFRHERRRALALAGVYRRWRSPDRKSDMDTVAIITTEPNELLAEKTGHDRMPVIIRKQDYQRWLEPGDEARPPIDMIRPFDSDRMKAWRVDRRVNNVRNNEPSLIEPVKEDAPPEEPKRAKQPKRKSDSKVRTSPAGRSHQMAFPILTN
jgi:putative SOS response-associated peptidase YedK